MASQDAEPTRKKSKEKSESSPLRDALINKVKGEPGEAKAPRVGARELGTAPPEEEQFDINIGFGNPNNLDRAIFCRQMATLIEVGIPVLKAFQMLAGRTANGRLRRAIADTAKGIEEGQSIHQAMARHERVYSSLVINIVRIGEMGGILEDSLVRLAEIMESKAAIKRKVISASMYPMVALIVAFGVIMAIMVKAIPVFASIYDKADAELPGTTRFIIDLSNFLVGTWWILIIAIAGGIIGLKLWSHTPSGKRVFSWLALKLPVFSNVNRKIAVARMSRTLGGLVNAGIPLIEAISITAETNENVIIGETMAKVRSEVENGGRMAQTMAKSRLFPPVVVDMIAVGEETGTLDRMLNKVADIYDVEVDSTLNGLSSIIEPLLIVFMGGVVILIALAVLEPYFNLVHIV